MIRRSFFALWLAIVAFALTLPATARTLADVPYRIVDKLLFVQVSVNGSDPVWMCIDTGASHTVLDPRLAQRLGIGEREHGVTSGTGQGTVATRLAQPIALALAGTSFDIAEPWIIDLSGVPLPIAVEGLVGAEIFTRYVVRLDPVAQRMRIDDTSDFAPPKGAVRVPMAVQDDRKLYVDVRLDVRPGLRVMRRVRVDTGSSDSVNDAIVEQARVTRKTRLGNGLGSDYEGVSGIYDAVTLGRYTWRNVWGPGGTPPSIGMELLRRFILTFDASRGALWLEPTSALNERVPPPE